ncbi:MAG: hypothetical protein M2R46_02831 [Verrucomicrobia subdivision 3 bacterium]|nr:hypothetical protein [Limisphaerales bacterium]
MMHFDRILMVISSNPIEITSINLTASQFLQGDIRFSEPTK